MANPKIQLRHDTSTNWQTQNPVLLEGEVAIETDSNKVKIGNGTDNYNTLPYITDQTKINLDYSNADYQPVNKSGDTMTGLLNINSADGYNSGLQFQHPDYKTGSIPANNLFFPYFKFVDKNERQLTEIYHTIRTTGESNFVINSKHISDSGSDKYIIMSQKTDGSFVFSFPDTKCVDGQWVSKYLQVETATYAKGTTTKQFSLSSYLPNDGKKYLVLGHWEGNSADALLQVRLTSDIISSNTQICRVPANTSGGSSFVFPIGTGRYLNRIAASNNASKATGNCYLTLTGYRRCGTNT